VYRLFSASTESGHDLELFPLYLLIGLLIASLIAVLNERLDQEHEWLDERPTDCIPKDELPNT
jgi:hypothetical protein